MSSLSISIPDSIRERIESLAREDGVSLDSFVASVLSQRVAAAEADSYIRRRASLTGSNQIKPKRNQDARCFLKNSIVRLHASFALSSS